MDYMNMQSQHRKQMFSSILLAMLALGMLFLACSNDEKAPKNAPNPVADKKDSTAGDTLVVADTMPLPERKPLVMSPLEERIRDFGLWNVRILNRDIRVKLRYSGTNNFVGADIYGALTHAYLQPAVARKLDVAQQYLDSLHPGYHILVWDAVRPISAQQKLWDSINKPDSLKRLYVAPPGNHSLHNYGCAADVTLMDDQDSLLDMGTDFDHFSIKAYPRKEDYCLRKGILTQEQVNNRQRLRRVMEHAGFYPITTEWWHFSACSRRYAKNHYKPVP